MWLSPENTVLSERRVPGDHACAKRPEQAAKETEVRLVFPGGGGGDGGGEGAPGKCVCGGLLLTSTSRPISAPVCIGGHRSGDLRLVVRSVRPNVTVPSVSSLLFPSLLGISFQGDKECPTLGCCDGCTALNTLNHCAFSVGEHCDVRI